MVVGALPRPCNGYVAQLLVGRGSNAGPDADGNVYEKRLNDGERASDCPLRLGSFEPRCMAGIATVASRRTQSNCNSIKRNSLMKPIHISDASFQPEVLNADQPV